MLFSVSVEKAISQGCFWVRLFCDIFRACAIQAGGNNRDKKSPHKHKEDKRCGSARWQPLVWWWCPRLLGSSERSSSVLGSCTELLCLGSAVGKAAGIDPAIVSSSTALSDFPHQVLLRYIHGQKCSGTPKNTDTRWLVLFLIVNCYKLKMPL